MTSGHRGVSWPVNDTLLLKAALLVSSHPTGRVYTKTSACKKKIILMFPLVKSVINVSVFYSLQKQVTLSMSALSILQENVIVDFDFDVILISSQLYKLNRPRQQQKIKWRWSLRHHGSSSELNIWVSDLNVLSPTEERKKKKHYMKKGDCLLCDSFCFCTLRSVSWICICMFQVLEPTCAWSWPRFQQNTLVLFRSFCGLGLLSNGYPGSPYPKKHLRGTFTTRRIFIKSRHVDSVDILWGPIFSLLFCFFPTSVQTLVKQFYFPIQHKGLHGKK